MQQKKMKIVIDQNIPGYEETFARHGEVLQVDGRKLIGEQLRDAQALIVRSITRVDAALLADSSVRFVGTATIGTDHLDISWLERHGITWACAPGCNADAAAQYTLAMMLLASRRLGFELKECSIGIVGFGNVGSRLCRLLKTWGVVRLTINDPPKAATGQCGLSDLDHIKQCDVVSFHVPLNTAGPFATQGMIGPRFLSCLKPHALLVNTSRGKVTESRALHDWLVSGRGFAALDVFPEEPEIDPGLIAACTVATPHIAGYSLDGKMTGTLMVYRQFCKWLSTPPAENKLLASLEMHALKPDQVQIPADAILASCPVQRDDANLRMVTGMSPAQQSAWFDTLRKDYPRRRDFAGWELPQDVPPAQAAILKNLGFH